MNKEQVRKSFESAKDMIGGDPSDPLVQIAFKEVFKRLLDQSIKPMQRKGPIIAKEGTLPEQVAEYLATKKIENNVERTVAMAYYNYHKTGQTITISELEAAYSNARVKSPKNFSDVLARCIRQGYMVEAKERKDGKKAWQVTPTGEAWVDSGFGRDDS